MSRKNIFEIINSNYNIVDEINKIINLYNDDLVTYKNGSWSRETTTLQNIFDYKILPNWKQRGAFLNIDEILKKLNIPKYFDNNSFWDINDIINLLEIYNNIIYLLIKKLNITNNNYYKLDNRFNLLVENIKLLLDHLNYEFKIFENEEKVILIPKNPAATAVAEISDEETAMAILMYNHHTLKGDLETKRHLLNSIAREYEPLLSKPIDGFKDYFVKAANMLNNLDIRHNNKEGKHKNNLVINLENNELEKWYDELYQLLLFCVLIKDNIERKNNIEEFLKNLKQGA